MTKLPDPAKLPEGMPRVPQVILSPGSFSDEMRAYGLACYQAGMERAAKVADRLSKQMHPSYRGAAATVAADIRAAKP